MCKEGYRRRPTLPLRKVSLRGIWGGGRGRLGYFQVFLMTNIWICHTFLLLEFINLKSTSSHENQKSKYYFFFFFVDQLWRTHSNRHTNTGLHTHRRAQTHAHTDTHTHTQNHIHIEQNKLVVKSKVPSNSKGLQLNRLTQKG
jgi:hypothetical protein